MSSFQEAIIQNFSNDNKKQQQETVQEKLQQFKVEKQRKDRERWKPGNGMRILMVMEQFAMRFDGKENKHNNVIQVDTEHTKYPQGCTHGNATPSVQDGGVPEDPYAFVFAGIRKKHRVVKFNDICKYCGAKRLQFESPGFCCMNGKTKLADSFIHNELHSLFTAETELGKLFRKNIRAYNTNFSFASMGVDVDKSMANMTSGLRCHIDYKPIVEILTRVLATNPYVATFRRLADLGPLDNYRVTLNASIELDQRVYNRPTTSEVAGIWVEGNDNITAYKRSIIVYGRSEKPSTIQSYWACYDSLSYPLFFPNGEPGWHYKIPRQGVSINEIVNDTEIIEEDLEETDGRTGRKTVSMREYYCYKLQIRSNLNLIMLGGRLFQQFVVDIYIKIETSRLEFCRKSQSKIRAELYQGVVDCINDGEDQPSMVRRRVVLPASFIGGPRDMRGRFLDAMALVQNCGKPDIFLTITCNPNWPEIQNELLHSQTAQDRPDLVSRVFRSKLLDLKEQLFKRHVLGEVGAYAYVIEFQKRGLPHAHFLLIMTPEWKLTNADHYDKYPRQFNETTTQGKDAYPVYRRRDTGIVVKKQGIMMDNRWVVPYNPKLLMMFNCHLNVEVIHIDPDAQPVLINEIKRFQDACYVSAPEATWRIFSFALSQIHPNVITLQLHLPNQQLVRFSDADTMTSIVEKEKDKRPMLTAFFKMNKENLCARKYLYNDFPKHFTWITQSRLWNPRKQAPAVGRLVYANPAEGERYYLRVLLCHIRGPTCFEDLYTVNDVRHPTFRKAALERGLIETDDSLSECLAEASLFQFPSSLRRLFATILVFCDPGDVRKLWNSHYNALSEDYRRQYDNVERVQNMVLTYINIFLQSMSNKLENFDLPAINTELNLQSGVFCEVQEECSIVVELDHLHAQDFLNPEQKYTYDEIMKHVCTDCPGVFFIDGPGGTGKTYL
ncbi:uncharacterized protein LOC111920477 [Lactuca sativa]|uniref:uncharacterized protein LOC111920477 n=1 Tax=Lactuca sativa TaxID=4236 RepID=UPI000CD8F0A8|nr:uncharacterized protein LOC111920477 [Lactuca sativa]